MKKLMTCLLAVLLCGLSFCWADGVTVSGTVNNSSVSWWEDGSTVTLTPSSGEAKTVGLTRGTNPDYSYSWSFKFENVTDGEYTLSFRGESYSYLYTVSQSVTVSGSDVTGITLNPTMTAMLMTVTVKEQAESEYDASPIEGAQVTYKKKDASEEGITVTTNSAGRVTLEVEAATQYTITVTATGYKSVTLEEVQSTTSETIMMEVIPVTLSGTLKMGETAVTALPEGMGLAIVIGGQNQYTPAISANGYSVECKAGVAKIYVTNQAVTNSTNVGANGTNIYLKLAADYTVTTPENGSFTITAADNTATQNIVLTKTAAVVSGTASVQLSDQGLTLTKQGETEPAYYAVFGYNSTTFRFDAVAAGIYTLGCKEPGYQIKGEAPVVTVTGTTDVNLGAVELEAVEAEYKFKNSGLSYWDNSAYKTVYIEGATLKLYPFGQTEGEALASGTTGTDGIATLKTNAKMGDKFTVTLEGVGLFPQQATVEVKEATNTVNGLSTVWLWASGKVNYEGDIDTGAFQILVESYGSMQNILGGYGSIVLFDSETGDFSLGASSSYKPNGTAPIIFTGREKDTRFFLYDTVKDVNFSNGVVTQNLTLKKDADKGYMRVGLKYQFNDASPINSISGVTINGYLPGDTYNASMHGTTDNYGYVYFLVNKDTKFDSLKPTIYGDNGLLYKAGETMKNVDGFFTDGQGTKRPNEKDIYVEGAEPTATVTISGNITNLEGLGSDVKVALQTQRDLQVMTAAISNGQYTFSNVPVFTQGGYSPSPAVLPIFLTEVDAKYDATYGASVPYNYAVTPKTVTVDHGATSATLNLTVVKIGCNVSGTVSPATSGQSVISLTKQGESPHWADIVNGAYKFQGVPAGTYTLNVNCPGYEPASKEVTVAETLADVTVEAITLTAAEMTVTVSGSLGATNPYTNKYEYFDGAELSIWNSEGTEKLAEQTLPEKDGYGYIQSGFTFKATAGTKVLFKMTHPSIEPVSKEYTVNGTILTINASDLNYQFLDNEDEDHPVMTSFKADWNATFDSLKLSWSWPANADGKIKKISMHRKLSGESGDGTEVKTWESATAFTAAELPVAFTDTVKQPTSYTYMFNIMYADLARKNASFIADKREGTRYTLTYAVNDDKMGTLTSYAQPAGDYMEGDLITVTAKANKGYKFVEFLKNDQKLTDAEIERMTMIGDTAATFGFNMPAENLTIKAVFAAKDPSAVTEYTVTLKSNNEAWGKVEGAGKFEEGTEIEVKATVTDATKYAFVAWKEGDKVVSEDATYKFKVEKDITLTAEFKELTANENLKAAQWAIFAEDGAIVIKGINGDRYDIYDLNGRLCGAALCTGAEIRLSVASSKLYIVRRLGADGSFDAKKIVVR